MSILKKFHSIRWHDIYTHITSMNRNLTISVVWVRIFLIWQLFLFIAICCLSLNIFILASSSVVFYLLFSWHPSFIVCQLLWMYWLCLNTHVGCLFPIILLFVCFQFICDLEMDRKKWTQTVESCSHKCNPSRLWG